MQTLYSLAPCTFICLLIPLSSPSLCLTRIIQQEIIPKLQVDVDTPPFSTKLLGAYIVKTTESS